MSDGYISFDDLDNLEQAMKEYEGDSEKQITTYLHGKGYSSFEKAIKNAMPESGKHWKRKAAPARRSNSIRDMDESENLAVTISSAKRYQYLYFPNDGSNTNHHFGNQQFFERGVEQETDNAINDMLELLQFEKK